MESHVPPTLRYACRYWATHLSLAGQGNAAELSELLDQFAGSPFMYWVEVMSLWGLVSERKAALVIEEALTWFSVSVTLSVYMVLANILNTEMHLASRS